MFRFKLFPFVLLFLLPLSLKGQVEIGLKGGLNLSTMTGYDDWFLINEDGTSIKGTTTYLTSYHLGLLVQFPFATNYFIQPEILFSRQGKKDSYPDINISRVISLNYLQLPIYAGYKYHIGGNLNLIFALGPYISYGISFPEDLFDIIYEKWDMGCTAMGGIQWDNLQITLGADFGLKKIVDQAQSDKDKIPSIKNQNFTLSIGCFF